jgi:DNA-directed RNA polymerase III subunit RPC1
MTFSSEKTHSNPNRSAEDIEAQAENLEISNPNLYDLDVDRKTTRYGALDPRLGSASKMEICETCGRDQKDCNGHWGFIKLAMPCLHVGYIPFTLNMLNAVCKVILLMPPVQSTSNTTDLLSDPAH